MVITAGIQKLLMLCQGADTVVGRTRDTVAGASHTPRHACMKPQIPSVLLQHLQAAGKHSAVSFGDYAVAEYVVRPCGSG